MPTYLVRKYINLILWGSIPGNFKSATCSEYKMEMFSEHLELQIILEHLFHSRADFNTAGEVYTSIY